VAYIKTNFAVISKTIARLEAVWAEKNDALDIARSTERVVKKQKT
jgi:hypothetical protein